MVGSDVPPDFTRNVTFFSLEKKTNSEFLKRINDCEDEKVLKFLIKNICLLKDNQWKLGIKSQLNWYKKNIKKSQKKNNNLKK